MLSADPSKTGSIRCARDVASVAVCRREGEPSKTRRERAAKPRCSPRAAARASSPRASTPPPRRRPTARCTRRSARRAARGRGPCRTKRTGATRRSKSARGTRRRCRGLIGDGRRPPRGAAGRPSRTPRRSSARWRSGARTGRRLCGNQNFTAGAFVLNRRVVLHAIDATFARWRGGVGLSPLDGAQQGRVIAEK